MILEDKRNYLKSNIVKTGDSLTIKSEGEIIESSKFKYPDGSPKKDFVVKVEVNNVVYDFTVNTTNKNILKAAFGKDTALWVGKTVKINLVAVLVSGAMKNSIVLVPSVDPKDVQFEP